MKKSNSIHIVNRKAKFEYRLIQSYEAGISLLGTEVKSIKAGEANVNDAFCFFKNNELYIKAMFVAEYELGTINNHEPKRDRKLLMRKPELRKLQKKVTEKGLSIVPYKLYLSERGLIKLEIFLAEGKKAFDKRQTIKDRESKRSLDRIMKSQG